jgi:ribosomal protein S27AE
MFRPGSKLYAIRKSKCPRCHQGALFKSSLFSGQGIYNMHKKCPKCAQDFELEPGFYWGAMYIGYGMYTLYMLATIGLLFFGTSLSLNQSFALTMLGALVMIPYIARRARVWWINIAIRFNKKIAQQVSKKTGK